MHLSLASSINILRYLPVIEQITHVNNELPVSFSISVEERNITGYLYYRFQLRNYVVEIKIIIKTSKCCVRIYFDFW